MKSTTIIVNKISELSEQIAILTVELVDRELNVSQRDAVRCVIRDLEKVLTILKRKVK